MLQALAYIEEAMPPETPVAFGLHPNAEIGFKLREGDRFCTQLQVCHGVALPSQTLQRCAPPGLLHSSGCWLHWPSDVAWCLELGGSKVNSCILEVMGHVSMD